MPFASLRLTARSVRLLPALVVVVFSLAAAVENDPTDRLSGSSALEPASPDPMALTGTSRALSFPIGEATPIRSAEGAELTVLAPGLYSSIPFGSTVHEPYQQTVISICTPNTLTSYEVTSPTGMVIEDAAAQCPWGQTGVGYFVQWGYGGAPNMEIGDNWISVEACDNYWQCSQQTGSIKYEIPIDSLRFLASDATAIASIGGYDTLKFVVENFHASETYVYGTPAITCFSGVSQCAMAPTKSVTLSPSQKDSFYVRVRGDTVGPRAVTVSLCRNGGLTCSNHSQTVAVVPASPVAPAVTVTAVTMTTQKDTNATFALSFRVKNTGTTSTSYALASSCDANVIVQGCSVTSSTSLIAPNDSATITMSSLKTVASASVAVVGAVRVVARAGGASATGQTAVSVKNGGGVDSAAVQVTSAGVSSGDAIARDQCLKVAAGDAAGVECGDLRVAHGLPTMQTLSRSRGASLLYLSRHASGVPLLAANVRTLFSTPSSVTAKLTVGGVLQSQSFTWPTTCHNQQCRIVIPVKPNGVALATGRYTYGLQVEYVHSGNTIASAIDSGVLIVVNRSVSPYGRGWWVGGVEQLLTVGDPTRRLWVGGDGSARVYKRTAADTNIYLAEQVLSRPDTLRRYNDDDWRRRLPNGAVVRFDSYGRHIRTMSSALDTTLFVYDDSGSLFRIRLPRAGESVLPEYRFFYSGSGVNRGLDSIRTQFSASGTHKKTVVVRSGQTIQQILSPGDTASVRFGVDTVTGRILWRRTRRGDTVHFAYDTAGAVMETRQVLLNPTDSSIVTKFCWTETRSLAQCSWGLASAVGGVPVPSVVTRIDGPRGGLIDVMTFHINRYGAPDTVQNQLGGITRTERSTTFPILATRVLNALGLQHRVWYNNRGLPDSTYAPWILQKSVRTHFHWNAKWALPDSIRPDTMSTSATSTFRFYNNATVARVDSQQIGAADSTRVRYYYSGASVRIDSVKQPGGVERFQYDTTLGNIRRVQSHDAVTRITRDRWGNDSLVQDADTNPYLTTLIFRGARGLVDSTRDSSRQAIYTLPTAMRTDTVPSRKRIVRNTYDLEGNMIKVVRADAAWEATTATTEWKYDAARRVRARIEFGYADSMYYDPAGNLTRQRTARGHSLVMAYDELDRLVARVVPEVVYPRSACSECSGPGMMNIPIGFPYYRTQLAGGAQSRDVVIPTDVETFTYDAVGRMLTADNRDARVSRSYHANGALSGDTLRIRPYDRTEQLWANPWSMHFLGFSYDVDKLGRRIRRMDTDGGRQTYTYDALGNLTATVDVDAVYGDSTIVTFAWDVAGRLLRQHIGGTVADTNAYDSNGRLIESRGSGFVDAYEYDYRGKQTRRRTTGYEPSLSDSSVMAYDGFGAVAAIERWISSGQTLVADELEVDALGNMLSVQSNIGWSFGRSGVVQNYNGERALDYGTHPLSSLRMPGNPAMPLIQTKYQTSYEYDNSGNRTREVTEKLQFTGSSPIYKNGQIVGYYDTFGTTITENRQSRAYFDARQRLRQFERNNQNWTNWHVVQEYRYDALGRRVLLRTQRDTTTCNSTENETTTHCLSTLERFFWDGDQLHKETRRFGHGSQSVAALDTLLSTTARFGIVRYAHALGIDAPLTVRKLGYSAFAPISSGRGGYEAGRWIVSGQSMEAYHWPARYRGFSLDVDQRLEPGGTADTSWFGSLLDNKADLSGMVYMRNRYYDPATGRFTQRDPIGLGGGLNQYGFASGDPLNNSDPFGLKVCFEAGSESEKRAMADALAVAAGVSYTWNSQTGCMENAIPIRRAEVAFLVADIINDPKTVVFRGVPGSKSGGAQSGEVRATGNEIMRFVIHFSDVGKKYGVIYSGTPGHCYSTPTSLYTLEQIMLHELGHSAELFVDTPIGDQAMIWERELERRRKMDIRPDACH